MSGVGLIIILLQLFPLWDSIRQNQPSILEFAPTFSEFNIHALCRRFDSVNLLFNPLLTKAIPSALAALIIGALTAYFLGWDVPIIGEIPSGIPNYRLESIQHYTTRSIHLIVEYAAVLACWVVLTPYDFGNCRQYDENTA
jgi:SulP family sulfate permease